MKKLISLLMVVVMVLSLNAIAFAAYETDVTYTAANQESYVVTVPAEIVAGAAGVNVTVTEGYWSTARKLQVVAPAEVELTCDINNETQDVAVTFGTNGTWEVAGNNTTVITDETAVSAAAPVAKFGTWTGTFTYTVGIVDVAPANP